MAQYHGDEERSQLGEQGQENSAFECDHEGRSDDCKNELQAEREPENMTFDEEKVPGGRNIPEDARGPDHTEGGESDYSTDLKEDAGSVTTTEMPAEEQTGPTRDVSANERALSDVYEQSPYTQYESKEDYNKQGYRGEGYQQPKETTSVARGEEEYQQTECAERGFSSPNGTGKYDESQQREPGLKEKVLDTLIPCHKTDTVDDEQPHTNGVPKSPGFMDKMKQKLTGKSHEAAAPDCELVDTPPKKNVIEKVKEQFSPST